MESVSSPSSLSGSAPTGKTPAPNSSRNQHAARKNRHVMEALERGRLLRLSEGKSSSRPIDERRDDSFGAANNVMGRTMHPPSNSDTVFPNTINRHNDHQYLTSPYHFPMVSSGHPSQWYQAPHPNRWQSRGNHAVNQSGLLPWNASRATRGSAEYVHHPVSIPPTNSVYGNYPRRDFSTQANPYPLKRNTDRFSHHKSSVIVPKNITIPKELSPSSTTGSSAEASLNKRTSSDVSNQSESPLTKRARGKMGESPSNMLDLLCSASLQLGAQQENPTGCSCPKSRCIALYCDCFKAGGRCDPLKCTCLNCKNTVGQSGPGGARTRAINGILARNPRAFENAGNPGAKNKTPHGDQACNCHRSRCLKLYCTCFQQSKVCDPTICTCVGCLNIKEDVSGMRQLAIEVTLEKRPDAFKKKSKTKILGAGCACKNNQCVRKYCECFRTELKCTRKCSCKDCKNGNN